MRLVVLLSLLIANLLFTGIATKAQAAAGEDAPDYYGIWASPDCATYNQVFVFTEHYMMHALDATVEFSEVTDVRGRDDYTVASFAGKTHPLARTEDGLLIVGDMGEAVPGEAVPGEWPARWDDLSMEGDSEYTHCAEMPALMPVPLSDVMKDIEGVRAVCSGDAGNACARLLFRIADNDGNKALSMKEFMRAGAILGAFTPLLRGGPVEVKELEDGHKLGMGQGAALASLVLETRDTNASGGLESAEMEGFLKETDDAALRDAASRLGGLFPALVRP